MYIFSLLLRNKYDTKNKSGVYFEFNLHFRGSRFFKDHTMYFFINYVMQQKKICSCLKKKSMTLGT